LHFAENLVAGENEMDITWGLTEKWFKIYGEEVKIDNNTNFFSLNIPETHGLVCIRNTDDGRTRYVMVEGWNLSLWLTEPTMTHDKHKCTKKWFIVDKEVLIKSSWAN
jgi:hypothetical protein